MNTSDPPFNPTTTPTTTSKMTTTTAKITTTTTKMSTTTTHNGDYNLRYPDKVMSFYIGKSNFWFKISPLVANLCIEFCLFSLQL